jgi:hypothetical protein
LKPKANEEVSMKNQIKLIYRRKLVATLLICILAQVMIVAQTQNVKTQEIKRQMEDYGKLLNPSAKQKVIQSAQALGGTIFSADKNADLYTISASSIKNQNQGLSSQEVDVLAMFVMFELWKSEEDDLKEMVNEIQKMNEAKKRQREYLEYLKKQKASAANKLRESYTGTNAKHSGQIRTVSPQFLTETAKTRLLNIKYTRTPKLPIFKDPKQMSASELEQAIPNAETNLDSLEEISQLQQLELQDAIQKQAQILQMISNIMKNQHDTLKSIIQNMRS